MKISRQLLCQSVLITALFTIGSFAAKAEDNSFRLIHPKKSSLVLHKKNDTGSNAEFHGHVVVSGTLIAQWSSYREANTKYNPKATPEYIIETSPASQAILPHYGVYQAKEIQLTNALNVTRMLAGLKLTEQFLKQEIPSLKMAGRFVLQDYEFYLECDFLYVKAKLVKIKTSNPPLASMGNQSGC